jgi:hypothetical protein
MADDDFAGKPTAEEQRALDTHYDRNAAVPLPPPTAKNALHSWSPGVSVIDRRAEELTTRAGYDRSKVQQLRNDLAEISKVLPGADGAVMQIAEGHIDNILAGARVMTDAEAEADEVALLRQIQANNAELIEHFETRYGKKDGAALLERTQRFVRSHPKLAAILKERGLGSRIDVVEALAAHVFSNGIR